MVARFIFIYAFIVELQEYCGTCTNNLGRQELCLIKVGSPGENAKNKKKSPINDFKTKMIS